ncbi:hypothetical protein [Marilutibacter chinensis]|uniref:Uncharacterized protein n=1 Tax=Marilutibacter chinensis TaxID=2912247 RepID=A0ABS9HX99_9GAMM|nr:hypothetical protein [Lysobacter chinensis]MCF7222948.1 hypothetical protein [Lysobacter chinensis]
MIELSPTRVMLNGERELLAGMLKHSSRTRRWKLVFENFFVAWAAFTLGLVVAWLLVAWVLRLFADMRVGLGSPLAIWIVGLGVPACGALAIVSTLRWARAWPDKRASLEADLANGMVSEEKYRISEVKRFQEPEHGGLVYCLRTAGDHVLVLYDDESLRDRAAEEDPKESSFRPCEELIIVRAPTTGFMIAMHFHGTPLSLPPPLELTAPVDRWPENEAFCSVPWDDLERCLSGADGEAPCRV